MKTEQPVLVIVGNPPYSGISANMNEWTERLLKQDMDGAQSYYKVDGQPLGEKNSKWLQDDYVKFLRFAQWKIQKSGYGIAGMITNHSYLDNPTFRGMRQSLMKTFDEIYILDLHGNSLKRETAPDGGKDENVFDIRQGVAIALFVRNRKTKKPKVFHLDLYGQRNEKYRRLDSSGFDRKNYTEISPASPWYFFVPKNTDHIQHYLKWNRIDEIFPENVTGIVTARDSLAVDFEKNSLKNKIMMFRNLNLPDEVVRTGLNLKDNYQWKLADQRKAFAQLDDWEQYFSTVLYRPFDVRHIYYHENIVFRTRYHVMHHMMEENIGLLTCRQIASNIWVHALVCENLADDSLISNKTKERTYVYPLYLYPDDSGKDMLKKRGKERKANIADAVFAKLESVYTKKVSPEDILYYVYGIFYSNVYRKTYAEFLKTDFPRVPFTADYSIFRKIGKLGRELADLHLLKSPALNPPRAKYQGSGDNDRIEKITYSEKQHRVYISKARYFEGISPEVWNYRIGGYQVLQKYLKDRKGAIMDNAPHYCRLVTALCISLEIQKKLDEIYPEAERGS
ncbi:MAG: type ISP restriction/modification enzyme, partial [Desulfobacterales bacterium]